MSTTQTTAPRTADMADEMAAGRTYPVRDVTRPTTHATASAHLRAIHAFWLAAADGYAALVASGCADSAYDAREALAFAAHYAPRGQR